MYSAQYTIHCCITKHNVKVEKVADTKNVDASEEVHHILENWTNIDYEFYMNWNKVKIGRLSSFQGVGKKVLKEHHIQ